MSDNDKSENRENSRSERSGGDRRGGGGDRRGGGGDRRGGGDDRRGGGGDRRGGGGRRRRRQYCPKGKCFDWKDVDSLRRYTTEMGKIKPRRQTGNCARCQRQLAREVKRARHMALLPFAVSDD
jgi:small subunit ribosomal protein S18